MFNLSMRLTGLIVFVPNRNPNGKVRMCALAVDARRANRLSLDGRPLKAHQGTLKIKVLVGMRDGDEVWETLQERPLKRQRLFLVLDQNGGVNNPHNTDLGIPGRECPLPAAFRPAWLLSLSRVYEDFSFDARLFDPVPPDHSVLAQVLLSHGHLRMNQSTRVVWQYQNVLSSHDYRQAFAHTVDSRYNGLQTAILRIAPFDAPQNRVDIDLGQLAQNRRLLVEISNVCENCPGDPQHPIPDRDTKWFFELMTPLRQATVRERLRITGAELPFPAPDGGCGTGGPGST